MHARARPMGVLEALGWIEERGGALEPEERAWVAAARQRMGCKHFQDRLTHEDRMRIIALGRKCAAASKGA